MFRSLELSGVFTPAGTSLALLRFGLALSNSQVPWRGVRRTIAGRQ
jgi:hypothetical protein